MYGRFGMTGSAAHPFYGANRLQKGLLLWAALDESQGWVKNLPANSYFWRDL
jgi:hypothetical protein